MSTATLNGATASRARVQVGAWGCWFADVDLTTPEALSGAATLVIADQTFQGTVLSGGAFDGRAAYRIVGGKGQHGKPLPKKGYINDAGVSLATVLRDAATSAGETLGALPTTKLGPHYARPEGTTLGDLLAEHFHRNWYVDFAGVTQLGQRPATTYTGTAPRTRTDPAVGVVELAVDSLAGIVPGVQVDGALPATDVEIEVTPDRITARIYHGLRTTATSRLNEALAAIVRSLFPRLAYAGTWEFRVTSQSAERLNLQPARVASGMPDLRNVPVRPGVAGAKAKVALGELVLVAFADCDPSRPQVYAHDAADAPGWMPLEITIGGPLAFPIAYQGSPVQAGPFSGANVGGSTLAKVRP